MFTVERKLERKSKTRIVFLPAFVSTVDIGRRCIILALLILISGCSTLINGPVQDIVVTSNPPGAIITTTTFEWLKTPGTFKLPRNRSTLLTANLYGYETAKQEIKCGLSLWPIVSGLGEFWAYGGCSLTTLDLSTGSIGMLSPTEIHFKLVPKVN